MTTNNSLLGEPAFWLLALLPVCAAIQVAAAAYLRGTRRELLQLVKDLVSSGLPAVDRAWLRAEVEKSKGVHLLIVAPFVPFAILAALAIVAYEGWRSSEGKYDKRVAEIDKSAERLERKTVEEIAGVDLATSSLWNDPRGKRVRDLAARLEDWNHPIAMVWIIAWLLVASPFLLVTYFMSGSIKPFVVNVWAPLRAPIVSVLKDIPWSRAAQQ